MTFLAALLGAEMQPPSLGFPIARCPSRIASAEAGRGWWASQTSREHWALCLSATDTRPREGRRQVTEELGAVLGLDSGLGQTLRGAQGSTALWPPKESDPSPGHSPCPAHRLSPAFPSCGLSPRWPEGDPWRPPGEPSPQNQGAPGTEQPFGGLGGITLNSSMNRSRGRSGGEAT